MRIAIESSSLTGHTFGESLMNLPSCQRPIKSLMFKYETFFTLATPKKSNSPRFHIWKLRIMIHESIIRYLVWLYHPVPYPGPYIASAISLKSLRTGRAVCLPSLLPSASFTFLLPRRTYITDRQLRRTTHIGPFASSVSSNSEAAMNSKNDCQKIHPTPLSLLSSLQYVPAVTRLTKELLHIDVSYSSSRAEL